MVCWLLSLPSSGGWAGAKVFAQFVYLERNLARVIFFSGEKQTQSRRFSRLSYAPSGHSLRERRNCGLFGLVNFEQRSQPGDLQNPQRYTGNVAEL